MTAVFKKEFFSYFRTMTGYALIAFLIVFTGIYFMVCNMYRGYPYFSYTLSGVTTILMVWIPVLTMRSFAEERKSRTDQLLFTAPVTIGRIVLGKFAAMAAVFLIPILFYCLFPLIIKASGTAYLLTDYAAIFQFFLMGCVFIAIGAFFSSVTESPVIAAVSTFAVIFLIYVWDNLIGYLPQSAGGNFFVLVIVWTAVSGWLFYITRNRHLAAALELLTVAASSAFFLLKSDALEGLFPDLLSRFNIMTAFNNAAYNSIFDVSGTVLQLTVIGVFLFLTVQSIEKRRWS